MQRIESINKLIHDKVNWATSLCDLLATIDSCVKNEEQFEKFEIEHNVLPRVGLSSLNNRFFKEVDNIIKQFLTPIILGKQRQQMNQSADNEDEIISGPREQEQDIRQVLFKSLIGNIIQAILEPNTNKEILFQQIPTIAVCGAFKPKEDQSMSNFTFKHLFVIRFILWNSESTTKSDKAIYAE
ncbi:8808_t:CDS:2, partial [Cetraspora pellucida]